MSGWTWEAGRAAAVARTADTGRCEVTGEALVPGETDVHHRQRRAVGGHDPGNLIVVGHRFHMWLHAHPQQARSGLWMLPASLLDPWAYPVWLRYPWPAWWMFRPADDDGPYLAHWCDPADYADPVTGEVLPERPVIPGRWGATTAAIGT